MKQNHLLGSIPKKLARIYVNNTQFKIKYFIWNQSNNNVYNFKIFEELKSVRTEIT